MQFPIDHIRSQFPALSIQDDSQDRIYFDNPAGTQVPLVVADAIRDLMLKNSANAGGHFVTSRRTDELIAKAHETAAAFLGARSAREVVIGQSMTSLTFHMSRSICRDFKPGDEIIVTRMEHEGNVGPWLEIAKDLDLVVRFAPFDTETWQVEAETLSELLNPKTRLVCLNGASNMTGSINNIVELTKLAKQNGSLVFVDAVQLAPHHLIDVQKYGCDFLAASAYKFFGPHLGLFWGKEDVMSSLHPYKGRCVSDELPDRFQAGTPQMELLAGLVATIEYFAKLGSTLGAGSVLREQLEVAYQACRDYEEPLTYKLIAGLKEIPNLEIYGITNSKRMHERVPTISFRINGEYPSDIAKTLAEHRIFVWHGHNYAYEPVRQLGLPLDEGVVRVGLAHYNTEAEVDRLVSVLRENF